MASLAAIAFIIAAIASLEARMKIVFPIAFALIALAMAVRALTLWRRPNA